PQAYLGGLGVLTAECGYLDDDVSGQAVAQVDRHAALDHCAGRWLLADHAAGAVGCGSRSHPADGDEARLPEPLFGGVKHEAAHVRHGYGREFLSAAHGYLQADLRIDGAAGLRTLADHYAGRRVIMGVLDLPQVQALLPGLRQGFLGGKAYEHRCAGLAW